MTIAGFVDINVEDKHTYTMEELEYMASDVSCCGCGSKGLKDRAGINAISKVASAKITARKP